MKFPEIHRKELDFKVPLTNEEMLAKYSKLYGFEIPDDIHLSVDFVSQTMALIQKDGDSMCVVYQVTPENNDTIGLFEAVNPSVLLNDQYPMHFMFEQKIVDQINEEKWSEKQIHQYYMKNIP